MALQYAYGMVSFWRVFSVKMSSHCSCPIYHTTECISHQVCGLVRYVSSNVTIFETILVSPTHKVFHTSMVPIQKIA